METHSGRRGSAAAAPYAPTTTPGSRRAGDAATGPFDKKDADIAESRLLDLREGLLVNEARVYVGRRTRWSGISASVQYDVADADGGGQRR